MVELQEKNFIMGGYVENAYPFRFWAILVAFTILLIYGFTYQTGKLLSDNLLSSPFLRVTNREFSLFLWQYPEYMRAHAKNKIGYLPGFQYLHKVNMEPEFTEEFVVVPPDTLHLYHTWKRLIASYLPERLISEHEFQEFLSALTEWQPYVKDGQLPFEVLQAFHGWKNYFKEGDFINAFNPTYAQMEAFLKKYPNYARNYWQNIVPNYLKSYEGDYEEESIIPREEVAPFLRVAIYNSYAH